MKEINDDLIRDLYVNQEKSTTQIGEQLGISHNTVLNHLRKMNIPRRNFSDSQFISLNKNPLDHRIDFDTIYDMYITHNMSKKDIAAYFNCDPCVINRLLIKFEIPVRSNAESKVGLMTGDKHPNWRGGITPLNRLLREYFNINLASKARWRDHFECQICGSKKNLHVHHKKRFKYVVNEILNEHPDLDPVSDEQELYNIVVNDNRFLDLDNLVTLCRDCHLETHGYRKTIRSEAS